MQILGQILQTTSENWFRGWDHSNIVSAIKIPPGKDVFYNTVEIKVQAKNVDNSTALVRKNITVKPIVIANKSAFVDDFLGTATDPAEKLAAVASTAFLVEVDVNYAEPDACGGCDSDHGTCNSLTQLCICDQGFKLSSLCNIPDDEKDQIAEVADTLATSTYIYIYIYIYVALVENSETALQNPEEAIQVFSTASNILSNQVPLPKVAKKIENMTYSFLDQTLGERESNEEAKLDISPDLANSLMQTLGKIGGSIFIQRDNDLQNTDDPSKQSGESVEVLEERSQKYVANVDRLSGHLVSKLLPATKLENVETGSFSLSGGRFTQSGISKTDLETKEGSIIRMPIWKFGEENTLVKYKHLVFKKNPRMNMTNATIGSSQRFSISSDDDQIMEISNLTDPLNLQFTLIGLSNASVQILKCSFYNSTLGKYSVAGLTTLSKTIFENGKVVVTCQSNHLSEFALATDPAMDTSEDTQAIIENSNLETMGEMDKIDEVDAETSKRNLFSNIYIYIYIYLALWLVGAITIIMLFLILTYGIYDYTKQKKKKAAKSRVEEGNKIEKPTSRGQIVPLEVLDLNEFQSSNEGIISERENLNNSSFIQYKKADSLTARPSSTKPSKTNTIHINYPKDTERYIKNANITNQLEFPIPKSDADTQTTITLKIKKTKDIGTKGCCATTLMTVAVIYIYIYIYI